MSYHHRPRLFSIRNPQSAIRNRSAFSLIEILVVIGILVGLMAILTPMIVKARKQAARTRQASDFQAIAMALEAFKADHGDYPRPEAGQYGTAFTLLGSALIAPGPQIPTTGQPALPKDPFAGGTHYEGGEVVYQGTNVFTAIAHNDAGTAPPAAQFWAPVTWSDGADGPGFRNRNRGRVYGPYLQPEKFKIRGYALLDLWGNPILYFPARSTGSTNVNAPSNPPPTNQHPPFVWDSRAPLIVGVAARPVFDVADNIGMLHGQASNPSLAGDNEAARHTLQKMLGDANTNGWIDPGESALTTGPFILWSAGPDAEDNHEFVYGPVNGKGEPDPNGKTDDVTNFDLPVGMLKK